jgi:nuclear pore complex protein Nup62
MANPQPLAFGMPASTAPSNQASLTTNTLTTQSVTNQSQSSMNFFTLEEQINKWKIELEEQEKIFTNQATQVNAWDNILLKNGEKIVELNKAVEKVKSDQSAMEQELEFISAQHAELEESIIPLEQELSKMPQQIDVERSQTYLMAETLDSQLKQMSEDLKEVIEHLNEANKFADPADPMVQIGKILNAHFTSLQWIEDKTGVISTRLDEITKMSTSLRQNQTPSFR